MSWYITIRSDAHYTRAVDSGALSAFLRSQPELIQAGSGGFESAPNQPWVSLATVLCDPNGSYNTSEPAQTVNLVDMVCSYEYEEGWYDALAVRIASFLGWEALEEHASRKIFPHHGAE
jgi:hypothetical protein